MALSTCLPNPRVFFQADRGILILKPQHKSSTERKMTVSLYSTSQLFGQNNTRWSFVGGCRIGAHENTYRLCLQKKRCGIYSCLTQFASCAFTLGTVAVLPFYTLMVFAPKSEITKKAMGSCIPYVILGIVYAYLLYRSWTPDTMRLMFASRYWFPELPGIAKMFSSEMTLASAWIHLLVVDLFAARTNVMYKLGLLDVYDLFQFIGRPILLDDPCQAWGLIKPWMVMRPPGEVETQQADRMCYLTILVVLSVGLWRLMGILQFQRSSCA